MNKKDILKVSGMSCAACSSRIEKGLNKIDLGGIIGTIEKLGYGAELAKNSNCVNGRYRQRC